jgi:prepilin peptidase CpaA
MLNDLPAAGMTFASTFLLVVLAVAAGLDLAFRRVTNVLILMGWMAAIFFALMSGFKGTLWGVAGFLAGLVFFIPFYATGMLGAADVKLMSIVGAFIGVRDFLFVVIAVLIAGGLVSAIVWLLWRMGRTRPEVPYALAIFLGVFTYVVLQ